MTVVTRDLRERIRRLPGMARLLPALEGLPPAFLVGGAVRDLLRLKESIRLATTDDAAAAAVISGLPWVSHVETTAEGLVVDAPTARSAEISQALASANIYLHRLEPLETSLEQYFLEVTGTAVPAGSGQGKDGRK